MATERLGRFLSEQLAGLPSVHHDRASLEHINWLTERYINKPKENPLSNLTPRQREVLGLIAQGFSNGKIAEVLVIEKEVVENYINKIYRLMGSNENSMFAPRVQTALSYIENTSSFENPVLSYFREYDITPLSKWQKTVVRYIGQGYTNQAIADLLTKPITSIEQCIYRILKEKMPVDDQKYSPRMVLALISQTGHVV